MQKKDKVIAVEGTGEAKHSFSEREKKAYVDHINNVLKEDPDLASILPINPNNNDLFEVIGKGVLLCKLINSSFENTIDVVLLKKNPKNTFEMNENHDLCIAGAKTIGCNVVNIGGTDLIEKKPHLVMGLLWQIIKLSLLKLVAQNPDLAKLDGEEEVSSLPPDMILLHWINHHLKRAGHVRTVKNFSTDLTDSENYLMLLTQIAPKECTFEDVANVLRYKDLEKRADLMLEIADRIGCKKFVTGKDIVEGNPRLNLAFIATLFAAYPALGPTAEDIAMGQVLDLNTKLLETQSAKDRLEFELREKNAKLLESLSLRDTLETALTEKEYQIQTLEQQNEETSAVINDIKKELEVEKERRKALEASLEQEKQRLQREQDEKNVLLRQLEEERKQKDALSKELDAEKKRNLAYDEELEETKTLAAYDTEVLQSRIKELEEELSTLKKEFHSVKEKLEASLSEADKEKRAALLIAAQEKYEALHRAELEREREMDKMRNLLSGGEKQGWLFKQGGLIKAWQKRYFVLKENMLVFYKDEKLSTKAVGVVYVEQCRIFILDEKTARRPHAFEISNGKDVHLVLAATSDEEAKSWTEAIKKAKHKNIGVKHVRQYVLED